jgi:hypothetical protein
MASSKRRRQGPQQHAEGAHGEKTHSRFTEQLHQGEPRPPSGAPQPDESNRRLHHDREQHDEAEKDSEKSEALRQYARGDRNENLTANARVPHGGDQH